MPWKQTDPKRVVRLCCGAWITVEALWQGHALLPHKPTCWYAR